MIHYQKTGFLESRDDVVKKGISERDFDIAFNGLLKVITRLNKLSVSDKDSTHCTLVSQIMDDFGIPQEKRSTILKAVSPNSRVNIKSIQSLPLITDVFWNFDVMIINGKPTPLIVLKMKDSTGQEKDLNLDLKSFHKLRYKTAESFKELIDLKSKTSLT